MTHTTKDYSSKYRSTSLYGNIDNSEVAARLKSCDVFDRRGKVIWIDDFEDPILRWLGVTSGVGASVGLNTTYSKSGVQSAKCVTGDAVGNYAGINKWLVYPQLSSLGFEISFTYPAAIDYIELHMKIYSTTGYYMPVITMSNTDTCLYYLNDAGVNVEFHPVIALDGTAGCFNTAKLVVDATTGYYKRYIQNNLEWDLSAIPMRWVASVGFPHYFYYWRIYTGAAANKTAYVDDAILTIDEP
jgi:hypothetical protein